MKDKDIIIMSCTFVIIAIMQPDMFKGPHEGFDIPRFAGAAITAYFLPFVIWLIGKIFKKNINKTYLHVIALILSILSGLGHMNINN